MTQIGIIGAGIAGLQLGLFLRMHGVPVTIYAERTPEEMLVAPLPSIAIRFGPTLGREQSLGIEGWDTRDAGVSSIRVTVDGPQPVSYTGRLSSPASAVDLCVYCATLLETLAARGGRAIIGAVSKGGLSRLADQHDLIVIAAGRGALAKLFPRRPEYSPYSKPRRRLCAGLFHGIAEAQPDGAGITFIPGQGEIFELPVLSFEGRRCGLLIEAVPGGSLDVVAQMSHAEDPRRFETTLVDLLRRYAPALYARIDRDAFGLTRPLDLLRGAIIPIVRRGYRRLENGRYAIALGDTHVTHDPILAQGANAASEAAWLLGEAIISGRRFDEEFCQHVEARIWARVGPAAAWSNAVLQPPPPHIEQLNLAAGAVQSIADAFIDTLATPQRGWEIVSSPERTAGFLAAHGWTGLSPPAFT